MLHRHDIDLVVDVRSAPYSKFVPQFSKQNIEAIIQANKVEYTYMGETLGGKPDDETLIGDSGKADYDLIRQLPWFQQGIDELIALAENSKVTIMCAEEDPTKCHRELLVGIALRSRGIQVSHIRADGLDGGDQLLDNYF